MYLYGISCYLLFLLKMFMCKVLFVLWNQNLTRLKGDGYSHVKMSRHHNKYTILLNIQLLKQNVYTPMSNLSFDLYLNTVKQKKNNLCLTY